MELARKLGLDRYQPPRESGLRAFLDHVRDITPRAGDETCDAVETKCPLVVGYSDEDLPCSASQWWLEYEGETTDISRLTAGHCNCKCG